MATASTTRQLRSSQDDDDQASVGELVERAISGARDLTIHEASLALTELEHDAQQIRTTAILAMLGASCVSLAVAWAGVALALALGLGPLGLGIGALVTAIGGIVVWIVAKRRLPVAILGKSRARLERRITRVTESLK